MRSLASPTTKFRSHQLSRPRVICRTARTSSMHTVPETFSAVMGTFVSHPSAAVPAISISLVLWMRLQQAPVTIVDVPVAAGVVGFWLVQEWIVHKWLLHSNFEWMGKTIHTQHHDKPYFHVSLDPPELILSVMALAAGVFWVAFQGAPLSLTAIAAYYSAGLVYEWLHYVVHTRWVPPSGWRGSWLRAVRRHHMLHHMRNEDYWLSFTAPAVDALFGTLPSRSTSVPLTAMARRAHNVGAAAAAAAGAADSKAQPDKVAAAAAAAAVAQAAANTAVAAQQRPAAPAGPAVPAASVGAAARW